MSVRSGARESMPGMLDTILNLGLNDDSVAGLAQRDRQRAVRLGLLPPARADVRQRRPRRRRRAVRGRDRRGQASARRAAATPSCGRRAEGARSSASRRFYEFPQDPQEQLKQAIRAVFESWTGERAVQYRRINRIPDDWGTAVNVQQMVFGNKGDTSATGVAFSRDEVTGAPEPSGDFLVNAQGEDVVSGVRTPRDLSELARLMPEAHAQLMEILRTLEAHYKDMQDTEFTVEEGQLYMLQTRNAKRPAQAAVRFAVDAVAEGLLTRERGAGDDRRRGARRAASSDVRPRRRATRSSPAAWPPRPARRGGDRVQRPGGGGGGGRGEGRDPRAPVHRGRGRRRLPRRQGRS